MLYNLIKFLFFCLITVSLAFPAFEAVPSEAHSTTIGNSAVAIPVDNSRININPSHLGLSRKTSISGTIFPQMLGIENGSINNFIVNAIIPIKKAGAIGIGLHTKVINISEGSSSIKAYSELQGSLAYGISLPKVLHLGMSVLIQTWKPGEDIKEDKETRFTLNGHLGATFSFGKHVKLGLVGGNLMGLNLTLKSAQIKEKVPRFVRLGLGVQNHRILLQTDAEYQFSINIINLRVGGEIYFLNKKLWIGAGSEIIDRFHGVKPTFGFGGQLKIFTVHYAFSYPVHIGGFGDHLFTISINF